MLFSVPGSREKLVLTSCHTENANLLHLLDLHDLLERIVEVEGIRHKNVRLSAQAKAAWEARMADEAHQCLLRRNPSSA